MNKNVWLLRPKPHGSDQMQYFLKESRIAIGYPVGERLDIYNISEIKKLLQKRGWEAGLSNVNILVHEMESGDIVVVPYGNKIYFGEIDSSYVYEDKFDADKDGTGFPHQRIVNWFLNKQPISRDDLPSLLRESLQYPGAVAKITKHLDSVKSIIDNTFEEADTSVITYQTAKDKSMQLLIDTIENEDIMIENRLKAVEILLKYT